MGDRINITILDKAVERRKKGGKTLDFVGMNVYSHWGGIALVSEILDGILEDCMIDRVGDDSYFARYLVRKATHGGDGQIGSGLSTLVLSGQKNYAELGLNYRDIATPCYMDAELFWGDSDHSEVVVFDLLNRKIVIADVDETSYRTETYHVFDLTKQGIKEVKKFLENL